MRTIFCPDNNLKQHKLNKAIQAYNDLASSSLISTALLLTSLCFSTAPLLRLALLSWTALSWTAWRSTDRAYLAAVRQLKIIPCIGGDRVALLYRHNITRVGA